MTISGIFCTLGELICFALWNYPLHCIVFLLYFIFRLDGFYSCGSRRSANGTIVHLVPSSEWWIAWILAISLSNASCYPLHVDLFIFVGFWSNFLRRICYCDRLCHWIVFICSCLLSIHQGNTASFLPCPSSFCLQTLFVVYKFRRNVDSWSNLWLMSLVTAFVKKSGLRTICTMIG